MENLLLCKSNFLTCVAVTAENLIRLYKRETSTLFRKQIVISLFNKFIAEIHLKTSNYCLKHPLIPSLDIDFCDRVDHYDQSTFCNLAYLLPRISKKETATQKGTKTKGSSYVKFLPFHWNGYPAFRNCCASGRESKPRFLKGLREMGREPAN